MKKIYKYIKIFFVSISALFWGSCEDFLETYPKDFLSPETFYETEDQLDAALRSVYQILASYSLYGDRMQSELALQADEGFNYNASPMGNVRHYNVSASDKDIYNFWQTLYKGIDMANVLLENIHRPKDMDEKRRNEIKGETLFLRGYFYFLLVQHFGEIPLKLESSKTADDGYELQSPIADVYAQIREDLINAEALVSPIDEVGYGGRVSKSAVQGILARVSLFMAGHPLQDQSKWKEAKLWAQKVIDSHLHELNPDYEQVFRNYAQDKYDYKESIFEVEFYGNNEPPYTSGGKVGLNVGGPLYHKDQSATYGVSYGWVYGVAWLHNSYTEGDVRRDRNIANYAFNTKTGELIDRSNITPYGRAARKWDRRDESATSRVRVFSPQNFPILRYSDVLLMFAEANNEIGGNEDSTLMCLNMVRRRGMGIPVDQDDAFVDIPKGKSQDELRQEIRDERPRELCYEALRKGDIVRWGIFTERMAFTAEEMSHAPGWGTNARRAYFTNASARDTLWPIPEKERGFNKNLKQNTGW